MVQYIEKNLGIAYTKHISDILPIPSVALCYFVVSLFSIATLSAWHATTVPRFIKEYGVEEVLNHGGLLFILYYYTSKINGDLQRFQDWWLREPTPSESWPNSSLDVSLQLYLQDLNKHVLRIILDKVSTYEVLLESLDLVSLRKKWFFDMLILDHKSFAAATPYYISALFRPRTNINGLVAVTACKYHILREKLLQIPCAQIMEYVKRWLENHH